MKGITPVVAVILLLLITVSMVGFAFVWFTRLSTSSAEKIENQTKGLFGKSLRIENAKGTSVDLRNTGEVVIGSSEIAMYINDVRVTTPGCPATIAAGAIGTCTITNPVAGCVAGSTLRVSVPGSVDTVTCK